MTDNNNQIEQDDVLDELYAELAQWLDSFEHHEVVELVDVVEKAKQYLYATEQIPEQQVSQFVAQLKYDLADFYQAYQQQAESSWYLALVKERFWQLLAQMTDKTQLAWQSLADDLAHQGRYQAGDLVSFGQFICQQCQESITITHPTKLSPCSRCQGQAYTRQIMSP